MKKFRFILENHNKLVESFDEYHSIMKVLSIEHDISEEEKITEQEYELMLLALMKSMKSIRRWSSAMYDGSEIVDELNFRPYFVKSKKELAHDVNND